jgi:Cu2+-containing amine oxidase
MFIAAPFPRVKTCKEHKCPSTDEQIKMWYTYTMEHFSTTEKNEIMPFAAIWMDLESPY